VPYRPLSDSPALFKTFADLEPSEDGFRRFANRYGRLTAVPPQFALVNGQLVTGDCLSRFLAEHRALKQVVEILDALHTGSGLRRSAAQISHKLIEQGLKGSYRGLKDACETWVQGVINERLSGARPGESGDYVMTVLLRDARGHLRLQQSTRSLPGVFWLQCARFAEGEQDFKQCKYCRDWFLVAPEGMGKRRQAIYCSAVCKVRQFRRKKAGNRRAASSKRRSEA
jgi:hypothetical protein